MAKRNRQHPYYPRKQDLQGFFPKRHSVADSTKINQYLNANWIWLGKKSKHPAPDETISDRRVLLLVVRSWILSAVLTWIYYSLYAYFFNNTAFHDKESSAYEDANLLLTAVCGMGATLGAFWMTFNCSLWNRRAVALQREGKTPLERFYLSNNVSKTEWKGMVKAEEEKLLMLTQNEGKHE